MEAHARRSRPDIASVHFALGDKDQAFSWLEKAYEVRTLSRLFLNSTQSLRIFTLTQGSKTCCGASAYRSKRCHHGPAMAAWPSPAARIRPTQVLIRNFQYGREACRGGPERQWRQKGRSSIENGHACGSCGPGQLDAFSVGGARLGQACRSSSCRPRPSSSRPDAS